MFNKGDMLVCVSTPDPEGAKPWLIVGKKYLCVNCGAYTEVTSERGSRQYFYHERFKLVPHDHATDAGAAEYEEIMSYGDTIDL